MSGTAALRRRSGEDRFYSPPPMRNEKQQSKPSTAKSKLSSSRSDKRIDSADCASSSTMTTATSLPRLGNLTNLDRFLEHTTLIVPAQHFPKSMKGWGTCDNEFHPCFVLGDLWETVKEWSAYGAGVPLVLNGSDSVIQYYVPYLSAIQLYIYSLRPITSLRRPGEEESDVEPPRETSSIGSSDGGAPRVTNGVHGGRSEHNHMNAAIPSLNELSRRNDPLVELSIDENEISNSSSLLVFEYLERDPPYSREPLADKISALASQFPGLKTYKSCDLSPASWISVAWYPIYRIPTGPTLQNLDACFLTFHPLSTPSKGSSIDLQYPHGPPVREIRSDDMPSKLALLTFGLASYKLKAAVWNSNGVHDCPKDSSLQDTADRWLRRLQVNHPDYTFFVSHSSYWR